MLLIAAYYRSHAGYNIPTRVCPYFILKLIAITDKTVRMALPMYNKCQTYDGSQVSPVVHLLLIAEARSHLIDTNGWFLDSSLVRMHFRDV